MLINYVTDIVQSIFIRLEIRTAFPTYANLHAQFKIKTSSRLTISVMPPRVK